jgi:ketosteroid isomerase-like protein
MRKDRFERWLDGYFAAWISNDAEDVAALFAEDAVYSVGPFADAWKGRDEIVRRWISGAQEDVEYAYEILAVNGEIGIARWNVKARSEGGATRSEWNGILLITFAPDGRCRDHREWQVRRELPPD